MMSRIFGMSIAVVLFAGLAGCSADKSDTPGNAVSSEAKVIVESFTRPIKNADELQSLSDVVIDGTFIKISRTGVASNYASGGGTTVDPPVNLWEFRVSKVISGELQSDETEANSVSVVRFNPAFVTSDENELAVKPGTRAILYLTHQVNGARVLCGSDGGLLLAQIDGQLLNGDGKVLEGAESLSVFY